LIPSKITENSYKIGLNLAVSGGDLNRIRDFFKSRLEVFNDIVSKETTLIISATDWQINDGSQNWGYLSYSTLKYLSFKEKLYFLNNKYEYAKYFIEMFKNSIMPNESYTDKITHEGFLPITGRLNDDNFIIDKIDINNHPYYKNIKIDGYRWREHKISLGYLSSKFNRLILIIPPISNT